jgi:hypothetical protein
MYIKKENEIINLLMDMNKIKGGNELTVPMGPWNFYSKDDRTHKLEEIESYIQSVRYLNSRFQVWGK